MAAAYVVTHLSGEDDAELPFEDFPSVIDELRDAEGEHGDVSLHDASGWCLIYLKDGRVILENLDSDEYFHIPYCEKEMLISMWEVLAAGGIAQVKSAHQWIPGYGNK